MYRSKVKVEEVFSALLCEREVFANERFLQGKEGIAIVLLPRRFTEWWKGDLWNKTYTSWCRRNGRERRTGHSYCAFEWVDEDGLALIGEPSPGMFTWNKELLKDMMECNSEQVINMKRMWDCIKTPRELITPRWSFISVAGDLVT